MSESAALILEKPNEIQSIKEKLEDTVDQQVLEKALKENVYSLLPYVWFKKGGFLDLEKIAFHLGGYTPDDPRRIAGCIADAVYSIMRNGSTAWKNAVKLEEENGIPYLFGTDLGLMETAAKQLLSSPYFDSRPLVDWYPMKKKKGNGEIRYVPRIKQNLFLQAAEYVSLSIREHGKRVFEASTTDEGNFRLTYLPVNWSEVQLSDCIIRLLKCRTNLIQYSDRWDKENLIRNEGLDEYQAEAIKEFQHSNICIWTGPPGSGKSKIIETLCSLLIKDNPGIRIAVAAPTGIAAQNLQRRFERSDSHVKSYFTFHPAQTLHSLLVMRPGKTVSSGRTPYSYKKGHTLDADVVIVDEFGMVDLFVARTLFWALRDDTRVVLVGDPHQLSSVGPGNVLYDLTYGLQKMEQISLKPGWVELKNVYRTKVFFQDGTEKNTTISLLADTLHEQDKEKRIHQFMNQLMYSIEEGDVEWIVTETDEETFEKTVENYKEEYRLITPLHEGVCGRIPLNRAILRKLKNSKSAEFLPGVPVIQDVTDYRLGIVNGEYGMVTKVSKEKVTATFNQKEVTLSLKEANEKWLIGYASTVHKSQGVEAPVIMLPVWSKDKKSAWRKKLFYTALTRAKQKVIIIGSKEQLKQAITKGEKLRRTILRYQYQWRLQKNVVDQE